LPPAIEAFEIRQSPQTKKYLMEKTAAIETKVLCCISDERTFHSEAPAMFTEVMKQVGVKGAYVPLKVDPGNIGEAMRSLKILNFTGANILAPYKEDVIPHLDTLSEGAQIIGAVNTIVHKNKELKGYNTNAIGFMNALEEVDFDTTGKSALIFGTGGTSRAVGFMLKWLHAGSISIVGRDKEKTERTANHIGAKAVLLDSLPDQSIPADIIINATTISTIDQSPELAGHIKNLAAPGCEIVMDLNYGHNLKFNIWHNFAVSKDIRFYDGLPMLSHQVKSSFALWTGIDVEAQVFLKTLSSVL